MGMRKHHAFPRVGRLVIVAPPPFGCRTGVAPDPMYLLQHRQRLERCLLEAAPWGGARAPRELERCMGPPS